MKLIALLLFPLCFFGDVLGQSMKTNKYYKEFKKKIENYTFPSFQGGNIKFNATRYEIDINSTNDSLIITRIKIPDANYSDPSNDKEIRTVALKDINRDSILIEDNGDSYWFKIYCKNKAPKVKYLLYKGDHVNVMYNDQIAIGRFTKGKFSSKEMNRLVTWVQDFLPAKP